MTELAGTLRAERSRRFPSLVAPWYFLALTAAVTYPWFRKPGLLFLLDFVWPPTLAHPTDLWRTGLLTSLPHEWAWWTLATVLPTSLVQKFALAVPIFLAGLSMFQLVHWLLGQDPPPLPTIAALAAGTFYALNPFVVTRVFMGQLYLLLAYALTPWVLLTVLRFLQDPSPRSGLLAGLTAAGVMLTNGHHVFLLPLLLVPVLSRRGWPQVRKAAVAWFLAPLALFFATAAALRALSADGSLSLPFNPLGPWARTLRAPWSDNLLIDSLALTATWKLDLPFAFPHEVLPGFGVLTGILLGAMGVGMVGFWRRAETGRLLRRLLGLAGVSIVLAIGVAHAITEPLAAWLYRHVPFFLGMRDSAKFLALLALVEGVLLGLGAAVLGQVALPRARLLAGARTAVLPVLLFAATLFYVSPAFRGFGGQITAAPYPKSWTDWNERLAGGQTDPSFAKATDFDDLGRVAGKPRMLFLPWHQYLPFSFTDDRTVANPALKFFTNAEVIAGDNSEIGGTHGRPFIYSESRRPLSKRIEAILRNAPSRRDLGARVAAEDIQYVGLATDSVDSASYAFLRRQAHLQCVFESPELTVWETGPLRPRKPTCGPHEAHRDFSDN